MSFYNILNTLSKHVGKIFGTHNNDTSEDAQPHTTETKQNRQDNQRPSVTVNNYFTACYSPKATSANEVVETKTTSEDLPKIRDADAESVTSFSNHPATEQNVDDGKCQLESVTQIEETSPIKRKISFSRATMMFSKKRFSKRHSSESQLPS